MKKTWSLTLCAASIAGALLCSCGEEEKIVPEMQKNTPAPVEKKAEQAPAAEEPELVPIQSLSQNTPQEEPAAEPAKAESAPVATTGSVQQQSEGAFVIQVSIQPSKKGADAIIKKLAEQSIKAYVAEVENPGELEGTYYRVRVGFFPTYAAAQEYGKQVLSALNFQRGRRVQFLLCSSAGQPAGTGTRACARTRARTGPCTRTRSGTRTGPRASTCTGTGTCPGTGTRSTPCPARRLRGRLGISGSQDHSKRTPFGVLFLFIHFVEGPLPREFHTLINLCKANSIF